MTRLRFVAVSATIPNIGDVAAWLGVPPGGIKVYGEELRPVKLTTTVKVGGRGWLAGCLGLAPACKAVRQAAGAHMHFSCPTPPWLVDRGRGAQARTMRNLNNPNRAILLPKTTSCLSAA